MGKIQKPTVYGQTGNMFDTQQATVASKPSPIQIAAPRPRPAPVVQRTVPAVGKPVINDYFENTGYSELVSESLFRAVIGQESAGNPDATGPKVKGGQAMGLMQVMPATAANPGFGIAPLKNPYDPVENARFGRQYLGALLKRYNGDTAAALAAYNWGMVGADTWVKNGKNMNHLPAETRNYIQQILPRAEAGMGMSNYSPAVNLLARTTKTEPDTAQNIISGDGFFSHAMSMTPSKAAMLRTAPQTAGIIDGLYTTAKLITSAANWFDQATGGKYAEQTKGLTSVAESITNFSTNLMEFPSFAIQSFVANTLTGLGSLGTNTEVGILRMFGFGKTQEERDWMVNDPVRRQAVFNALTNTGGTNLGAFGLGFVSQYAKPYGESLSGYVRKNFNLYKYQGSYDSGWDYLNYNKHMANLADPAARALMMRLVPQLGAPMVFVAEAGQSAEVALEDFRVGRSPSGDWFKDMTVPFLVGAVNTGLEYSGEKMAATFLKSTARFGASEGAKFFSREGLKYAFATGFTEGMTEAAQEVTHLTAEATAYGHWKEVQSTGLDRVMQSFIIGGFAGMHMHALGRGAQLLGTKMRWSPNTLEARYSNNPDTGEVEVKFFDPFVQSDTHGQELSIEEATRLNKRLPEFRQELFHRTLTNNGFSNHEASLAVTLMRARAQAIMPNATFEEYAAKNPTMFKFGAADSHDVAAAFNFSQLKEVVAAARAADPAMFGTVTAGILDFQSERMTNRKTNLSKFVSYNMGVDTVSQMTQPIYDKATAVDRTRTDIKAAQDALYEHAMNTPGFFESMKIGMDYTTLVRVGNLTFETYFQNVASTQLGKTIRVVKFALLNQAGQADVHTNDTTRTEIDLENVDESMFQQSNQHDHAIADFQTSDQKLARALDLQQQLSYGLPVQMRTVASKPLAGHRVRRRFQSVLSFLPQGISGADFETEYANNEKLQTAIENIDKALGSNLVDYFRNKGKDGEEVQFTTGTEREHQLTSKNLLPLAKDLLLVQSASPIGLPAELQRFKVKATFSMQARDGMLPTTAKLSFDNKAGTSNRRMFHVNILQALARLVNSSPQSRVASSQLEEGGDIYDEVLKIETVQQLNDFIDKTQELIPNLTYNEVYSFLQTGVTFRDSDGKIINKDQNIVGFYETGTNNVTVLDPTAVKITKMMKPRNLNDAGAPRGGNVDINPADQLYSTGKGYFMEMHKPDNTVERMIRVFNRGDFVTLMHEIGHSFGSTFTPQQIEEFQSLVLNEQTLEERRQTGKLGKWTRQDAEAFVNRFLLHLYGKDPSQGDGSKDVVFDDKGNLLTPALKALHQEIKDHNDQTRQMAKTISDNLAVARQRRDALVRSAEAAMSEKQKADFNLAKTRLLNKKKELLAKVVGDRAATKKIEEEHTARLHKLQATFFGSVETQDYLSKRDALNKEIKDGLAAQKDLVATRKASLEPIKAALKLESDKTQTQLAEDQKGAKINKAVDTDPALTGLFDAFATTLQHAVPNMLNLNAGSVLSKDQAIFIEKLFSLETDNNALARGINNSFLMNTMLGKFSITGTLKKAGMVKTADAIKNNYGVRAKYLTQGRKLLLDFSRTVQDQQTRGKIMLELEELQRTADELVTTNSDQLHQLNLPAEKLYDRTEVVKALIRMRQDTDIARNNQYKLYMAKIYDTLVYMQGMYSRYSAKYGLDMAAVHAHARSIMEDRIKDQATKNNFPGAQDAAATAALQAVGSPVFSPYGFHILSKMQELIQQHAGDNPTQAYKNFQNRDAKNNLTKKSMGGRLIKPTQLMSQVSIDNTSGVFGPKDMAKILFEAAHGTDGMIAAANKILEDNGVQERITEKDFNPDTALLEMFYTFGNNIALLNIRDAIVMENGAYLSKDEHNVASGFMLPGRTLNATQVFNDLHFRPFVQKALSNTLEFERKGSISKVLSQFKSHQFLNPIEVLKDDVLRAVVASRGTILLPSFKPKGTPVENLIEFHNSALTAPDKFIGNGIRAAMEESPAYQQALEMGFVESQVPTAFDEYNKRVTAQQQASTPFKIRAAAGVVGYALGTALGGSPMTSTLAALTASTIADGTFWRGLGIATKGIQEVYHKFEQSKTNPSLLERAQIMGQGSAYIFNGVVRTSSQITTTLSNGIRFSLLTDLVAKGMPMQEAVNHVNNIMFDYNDIPPNTKKVMNLFLFTPLFKTGIIKEVNATIKAYVNAAGGNQTDSDGFRVGYSIAAMGALTAADMIFTGMLGMRRDRFGLYYSRESVEPISGKPNREAISLSNPLNWVDKEHSRIEKAFSPAASKDPLTEFLNLNKAELHPIINLYNEWKANERLDGLPIYETNLPPLTKFADLAIYSVNRMLPITTGGREQSGVTLAETKQITNNRGLVFTTLTSLIGFNYVGGTDEEVFTNKLKGVINSIRKETSFKDAQSLIDRGYTIENIIERKQELLPVLLESGIARLEAVKEEYLRRKEESYWSSKSRLKLYNNLTP